MGIGPIYEKIVPYKYESGKKHYWEGKEFCYEADGEEWIVDEDTRFMTAFEIEDCNILPSPASVDKGEDGTTKYTYNEDAEKVIKSELMNGRAVSISYHGEPSKRTRTENSSAGIAPSIPAARQMRIMWSALWAGTTASSRPRTVTAPGAGRTGSI